MIKYFLLIICFLITSCSLLSLHKEDLKSNLKDEVYSRNDSLFVKETNKPYTGVVEYHDETGKLIKATSYVLGMIRDEYDYSSHGNVLRKFKIEEDNNDLLSGKCRGKIIDEMGTPLKEVIVKIKNTNLSTITDDDGIYKFDKIQPGKYQIIATAMGYTTWESSMFEISSGYETSFSPIKLYPMDFKPVLYLYPNEITEMNIKLNSKDDIIFSYPEYEHDGWNIIAHPNGKIINKEDNREYYCLFWENKRTRSYELNEGFVVKKCEVRDFLEEKLDILCLTKREANEFIIFWFPILGKNDFSLIKFDEKTYINDSKLFVNPKPDTLIRVHMVVKKLDQPIEINSQNLERKERKGFTAVEWGGTIVK